MPSIRSPNLFIPQAPLFPFFCELDLLGYKEQAEPGEIVTHTHTCTHTPAHMDTPKHRHEHRSSSAGNIDSIKHNTCTCVQMHNTLTRDTCTHMQTHTSGCFCLASGRSTMAPQKPLHTTHHTVPAASLQWWCLQEPQEGVRVLPPDTPSLPSQCPSSPTPGGC